MILSKDKDGNTRIEKLEETYDELIKLGMPKIEGFIHLDEKNWPGSKEGLPCWAVLAVLPGENSGRWIPIHPDYIEQQRRAAIWIDEAAENFLGEKTVNKSLTLIKENCEVVIKGVGFFPRVSFETKGPTVRQAVLEAMKVELTITPNQEDEQDWRTR